MRLPVSELNLPKNDGIILDEGCAAHFDLDHPLIFRVPGGEQVKTFEWFEKASEFFLQHNVMRSFHLWGIGGGATTDLAGFVASCLLRGVEWSSVPTTLLGQVDAAIGGKTGLNTSQGKNLVGSFWNPKEVYLCQEVLLSLSEKEIISGKGEILKYALLNPQIKKMIFQQASLTEIIDACYDHKKTVVKNDFHEKGERISLNLGHTLGHVIESKYKISHGEAVASGVWLESSLFAPQYLEEIEKLSTCLGIESKHYELTHQDLILWATKDKKRTEERQLSFVLPDNCSSGYKILKKPLERINI